MDNKRTMISANIMVKNEERTIKRCLESIVDFADEIIIVDTGSTDRTVEIIKNVINKYSLVKIKLLFFDWNDNFSEVRNFMLQNSSGDIIFQIDADEALIKSRNFEEIKVEIKNKLEKNKNVLLVPTIINANGSSIKTIPRIFKNNKEIAYVGNVHEEIRNKNGEMLQSLSIELEIYHGGYLREELVRKSKLERNILLLNKIREKEPWNPRWQYFLIRENYYIGVDRKVIAKQAEEFVCNIENKEKYLLIYVILGLCYIELDEEEKVQKIIIFLQRNKCMLDATFIELTLLLWNIRKSSDKLDEILNDVCNIQEVSSQINSSGDHVRVQIFRSLFALARYKEAFCVFEEINHIMAQEFIVPELLYVKQNIEPALNQYNRN